jgi:hypothetical protein
VEASAVKFEWSLETNNASFDFSQAVVIAKTLGFTGVQFHYGDNLHSLKRSEDEVWDRVRNLLIPIAELAGLQWDIGREHATGIGMSPVGKINSLYKELGRIYKFPMLKSPFKGYVTVTLRSLSIETERNSSGDWPRIIEEISKRSKVVVMQDDMTVEERMRLYSGARMNIGVNSGPMALCHYSEAPHLAFKFGADAHTRKFMEASGFPFGSQLAFRNERQRLVWEPDDFATVMRHFEELW